MPNVRPDIELANGSPSQHQQSDTAARVTDAPGCIAGTMRLPSCLPCKLKYAAWSDALPDNTTAEPLQAIVDLDLDELATTVPPRGYGLAIPSR
jgi:hypothetical protein